jgi:uncharacterized membrane protein
VAVERVVRAPCNSGPTLTMISIDEQEANVIKHSIEINRPATEVFGYLDELERHGEWQSSIVSAKIETEARPRAGTRVVERRKVPGGVRDVPYEITEYEPPRRVSFRGTAGPVRPVGTVTVDAVGDASSRVTVELDLEGHGLGKLVAFFARRQAAKEVPQDQQRLKQVLESAPAPAG